MFIKLFNWPGNRIPAYDRNYVATLYVLNFVHYIDFCCHCQYCLFLFRIVDQNLPTSPFKECYSSDGQAYHNKLLFSLTLYDTASRQISTNYINKISRTHNVLFRVK